MKICSNRVVPSGQTEGRTDRQTDRHDAFLNLADRPNKTSFRFRLNLLVRNRLLCREMLHVALPGSVRFLGAFANLQIATLSFIISLCSSVRAHGTTLLPLHGFSWKLIFAYIFNICRENSHLNEIWQEWLVIYIKTNLYLSQYRSQFFLQWAMFHTAFLYKTKTHILCSITYFRKSCRLWDDVEKYCRARQVTEENMKRRVHIAHRMTKAKISRLNYVISIVFEWQPWFF